MYLVKTPWLLKKLYPNLIWNKSRNNHCIYLTFDDGPIPIVTPFVLNILKQYNAKATFFCIGDNVSKHPDVFEQVKDAGHNIGNHTYNHLKGWKTEDKIYVENFLKADEQLHTNLFRPPYGRIKKSQIKLLKQAKPNLDIIMWDVLSGDFDINLKPEACLQNVLKHTENGSIIVFHDSLKAFDRLEYVLPRAMEEWSKQGYSFGLIRPLNPAMLDKYKIKFKRIGEREMDVVQVVPTENNFHLCSYFMNMGLAIVEEDVLPNLDKAINGQPFEEDAGGFISFLTIGPEVSSFDSTNKADGVELIPTRDIRDILVLWIDWIYKNNLEKYF